MKNSLKGVMRPEAPPPLLVGFFPLEKAAVWAGVSEKTLKRMIHRGLPYYQTGPRGKILLKPSDIERFMKQPKQDLDVMVEEVMGELARGKG